MLAYVYPILSILWTMLIFAGLAFYVWMLIWVVIDDMRRTDHSGLAKALWIVLVIFLPLIGILSYVATRPVEAESRV